MAHALEVGLGAFAQVVTACAVLAIPVFLEPELGHDGAEAALVGLALQVAVGGDLGGYLGQGEEHGAGVLHAGGREVEGDELLFAGGHHEGVDVGLKGLYLVEVEPVVEALLQQVAGLGVHAVVGQAVLVGRVDGVDVEGQPAAVAGLVGQKLLLVARGGIRGHAHALLLVAAEGGAHVDVGLGNHRLQLVQLAVGQLVQLVDVDQPVLGGAQLLVLVQPVNVDVVGGVGLQQRRQQAVEPRRLEDALAPDEHDDLVVDDVVAQPAGHHGREPLGEDPLPELLLLVALHVHHAGGLLQVVGLVGGPRGQRRHVLAQRIHLGHDARVEHRVEQPFGDVGAGGLAALNVQVVLVAVLQLAPVAVGGLLARLLRQHVVLQVLLQQEVADYLGLQRRLRTAGQPHAELVLRRAVAAVQHLARLAVHVAQPLAVDSLGGLVLVDAHAVQYEADAHHEVVALAGTEARARVLLHHAHGPRQPVAQGHADGGALTVTHLAGRLHADELAVTVDAQLLACQPDGGGVGAPDGLRVVAQTHQAVHVLALQVHVVAAPDGILAGYGQVGAVVQLLGALRVLRHVNLDALGQREGHHHVVAQTRDALVAQPRVVRRAHERLHALQLLLRQPLLGPLRVEVDEHLVQALAARLLAASALHAEADGHLRRLLLHRLGGLLLPLRRQRAIGHGTRPQLLVRADHVEHLLQTDVLSVLAVECLE